MGAPAACGPSRPRSAPPARRRSCGPDKAVPIHWGTFVAPGVRLRDPARCSDRVRAARAVSRTRGRGAGAPSWPEPRRPELVEEPHLLALCDLASQHALLPNLACGSLDLAGVPGIFFVSLMTPLAASAFAWVFILIPLLVGMGHRRGRHSSSPTLASGDGRVAHRRAGTPADRHAHRRPIAEADAGGASASPGGGRRARRPPRRTEDRGLRSTDRLGDPRAVAALAGLRTPCPFSRPPRAHAPLLGVGVHLLLHYLGGALWSPARSARRSSTRRPR